MGHIPISQAYGGLSPTVIFIDNPLPAPPIMDQSHKISDTIS